ncbi:MAG: MFS transporter [Proteobacteria bacterium]|nr:MAG: MFS transporter [Pseudomonadota bacterium]
MNPSSSPSNSLTNAPTTNAWLAITSIALGVAGLIIAEFLPAGMLSPMARDLAITEGMAGQAVTATSIFAVITSLLIAFATRNFNRRPVLLALSGFLVASNIVVAYAPSFTVLLAGRVLLGVALGGFWSMAAATAARLVTPERLPRALALIFGASSFASVFAAPLSSYLSNEIGWRNVFLAAGFLSALALALQFVSIPSLKPIGAVKLGTLFKVLALPSFTAAMLAVALVFGGFFCAFTYVRPFLESAANAAPSALTLILLLFGVANFIGTSFGGKMVEKFHEPSLWLLPLILSAVALGIYFSEAQLLLTALLIFAWGFFFGPVSVVWSTWVTQRGGVNAETAGGLYVAAIQLSAAVGAVCGGMAFDRAGPTSVFVISAAASMLSVGAVLAAVVRRRPA